jgi:hypothetical protein
MFVGFHILQMQVMDFLKAVILKHLLLLYYKKY